MKYKIDCAMQHVGLITDKTAKKSANHRLEYIRESNKNKTRIYT